MAYHQNCFDLVCPDCCDGEALNIQAQVWVRLTIDGTDADATGNGDHEWTNDSCFECCECGRTGTVGELIEEEA